LKTSWLRRNGVPRSDRATVVERFTRHGNYLSVVTTVYDPVYLSEPYVRSREMALNPAGSTGVFVCETVEEIARPLTPGREARVVIAGARHLRYGARCCDAS
jgi:hypothetical protein